jgi:hypothetical protein
MNRQQAKELLPIISAFAEGETIQVKGPDNRWYDSDRKGCKLKFDSDPQMYRIKPKYRPFRNKEECWNEMLKHQPFGWVKHTSSNEYFYSILEVVDGGCVFVYGPMVPFDEVYEFNTFADGTPFGIED